MDRISRETTGKALEDFLAIVKWGVNIISLVDNVEVNTEKLNQNAYVLFQTISTMVHCNDESLHKSNKFQKLGMLRGII